MFGKNTELVSLNLSRLSFVFLIVRISGHAGTLDPDKFKIRALTWKLNFFYQQINNLFKKIVNKSQNNNLGDVSWAVEAAVKPSRYEICTVRVWLQTDALLHWVNMDVLGTCWDPSYPKQCSSSCSPHISEQISMFRTSPRFLIAKSANMLIITSLWNEITDVYERLQRGIWQIDLAAISTQDCKVLFVIISF